MPLNRTRALRAPTALGIVAVTTGAALLIPGTANGEVAGLNYTGTAAADPFRMTVKLANFPASNTPVDSGGPSAQATLSSSGGGLAYSAAPDPGTFLAGMPQLGKGVVEQNGLALPFAAPDYPLAISANDQAPSQQVGAGGYELAAEVAPSSAQSRTKVGAQTPGGNAGLADAAAQVIESADGVAAKAISDVQGLTVGPVSIGTVRSIVSVAADANGNLTRSSSFAVDGLRIGNLPVGLARDGFTVAGQPAPSDQQAALNDMLESAGVALEQFPQTETPHGVNGAGVIITHKFDTPSLGATTVTYRLGGAAVALNAAGSRALGQAPAVAPSGTVAPGTAPAATAPLDGAFAPGVTARGSLPQTATAFAAAPLAGQDGGAVPTVAFLPTASALPAGLSDRLYLGIVLTGVLGFGVTRALRPNGVR